jgi:hypothetical protein
LHALGVGGGKLRERRLQAAIVHQCNLHRVFDADRTAQQGADAGVHLGRLRIGLDAADILAKLRSGNGLHRPHAAVRGETRAAT